MPSQDTEPTPILCNEHGYIPIELTSTTPRILERDNRTAGWASSLLAIHLGTKSLHFRKRNTSKAPRAKSLDHLGKKTTSQYSTCASDYDEIKTIIEPYWHMFNLCLGQTESPVINELRFSHPSKNNPDRYTVITLCCATDETGHLSFATGAATLPPFLPLRLQAGISKFNMCDRSVEVFFRYIEDALLKVDATIEWLVLTAKPRTVLHYDWQAPKPTVRHSLFGITSRHGHQFMADFTIEQFGFESSMWFQTRDEYLSKCTLDGVPWRVGVEKTKKATRRVAVTGIERVVQEICDDLDMADWKTMSRCARIDWLKKTVREAYRREFEDEKGERKAMVWTKEQMV